MTAVEKKTYRVIGARPIRPDGVEKVTGKALFGADARPAGLIYGKILRSPHAHARIISIDTSEAEAVPGVLAVMTASDLPAASDEVQALGETAVNLKELSDNVLASDKVLYRGHAVAAVAAVSVHVAEQAARRIRVQYEPLPVVLDVREAMLDDAPLLNENLFTRSMGKVVSDRPSNVASTIQFAGGDTLKAFAEADAVVERHFTTKMVHQGYIEPQTATAQWNHDGEITVWATTQGAFACRGQLTEVLRRPASTIRVIPMEVGGGFGGKTPVYLEPVAAILSRKSGRPVKITMSRAEVFEATGPTSGTSINVKLAAKDGRLSAAEIEMAYEAGAYPGSSVNAGAMTMLAPYNVEHFKVEGADVVVNKPKTAAYRAPGSPAAAFALEQAVDELARAIGADPLAFREASSSREGTRLVNGMPFPRIGHEECLRAAMDSPHYRSPIEGPNRGRGVASGYWFNAGMQSSVTVSVNTDGTVNLIEGSSDLSGTRASLAMQLAETLGIEYGQVRVAVADTDSVGYNDVSGGSRTTFATGMAAHQAALDIQQQMRARAAKLWGCPEEEVVYEAGQLRCTSDEAKTMTFGGLAAQSARTGGPITARASLLARGAGGAFGTHIVDVEVDPETGKVQILRYTAVQDVGTAIHPAYVEGQIQGGVAQGIGWALNEEYYYDDDGRLANASFLDYRMPTALDLPSIDTVIVEVPNPGHPYGVRGAGEVPIVPPLAAVANAIADATGHRFTDLPISPRRIVEALHHLG